MSDVLDPRLAPEEKPTPRPSLGDALSVLSWDDDAPTDPAISFDDEGPVSATRPLDR